MTPLEIGIIGIIAIIIMLILRVPVGISLIFSASAGMVMLAAPVPALELISEQIIGVVRTQVLVSIPMFVLMGVILSKTNMASALFEFMSHLFGRGKGGLALSVLGSATVFSAMSESFSNTFTNIKSASESDLRGSNYDTGLSIGINAVGSALGVLIPPSTVLIIFAYLAGLSVGHALLAGIAPGALTALLLLITSPIILRLRPKLVPDVSKTKTPFPINALKVIWVIPIIFIVVFLFMYFGWLTLTESSAVGALLTLLFAVASRQMSFTILFECLFETAKITGKLFLLIIGGTVFNLFLTRSLVIATLTSFFTSLNIAPIIIIALFMLIYILLSLVLDKLATLVILTPFFLPIALALRFNGLWFGVMISFALMIGYCLRPLLASGESVDNKVPTSKKLLSVNYPFLIIIIIISVLVALFPYLATLLPSMMIGW